MLERCDSPWYPTVRLFRQSKARRWSDVIERMAAELANRATRARVGRREHVDAAPRGARTEAPMTTIQESLQAAFAHHEAGDLAAASQIYRQILAVDPQNATARHRLGVVALQSNQLEPAARLIGDAIRLDGSQAISHVHLGEVHFRLGQLANARR